VVLAGALAATALLAAACGGGSGGLVSAQQTNYQKAVAFSQCMRAHGPPTFPDPHVNSSGIELQLPKGLQPNSPVFRAAQQACKNLMPGLP